MLEVWRIGSPDGQRSDIQSFMYLTQGPVGSDDVSEGSVGREEHWEVPEWLRKQ
jgi:hypothetical protein